MLNGDKQNQAEVLPDVPMQTAMNCLHVPNKVRNQAKVEMSHKKENCHSSAKQINILKVNVKDYAGWTPLHEACNHGSTVCVREILQRCPEVDLLSEVNGTTPLHDALVNGHVEIAKLLLQHGGVLFIYCTMQLTCQANTWPHFNRSK
uniref:Uncharacterized protein n=1 Tax=Sphaerodactylus townsendi TaxID=933632 RepID=A0ACB8EQA1_9SAUR